MISLSGIETSLEGLTQLIYIVVIERLNMQHTKAERLDITKIKIEFLNLSNQKMFIFYRKICKKIIFQTALLS